MRATAALALVAVLATGCLSLPPRYEQCGAPADYQARAFPPTDRPFDLRDVISADLNDDGALDLVISSVASTGRGFYVLLGPQTDPAALVYHAFVETAVVPDAMAIKDVLFSGRGCRDVTVFGQDPNRASGFVEVYELVADRGDGGWQMFDPVPAISKDVEFMPVTGGVPVMVAYGDFQGLDHGLDVVVADLYTMRMMFTEADLPRHLPTATVRDIGRDGAPGVPWNAINAVYPELTLAGTPQGDDLVIVELEDLTWLRNDGSGTFTVETRVHSDDFSSKAPRRIDLDGVDPIDVAGASGVGFGAYVLARDGGGVDVSTLAWNQTFPVYNELNDFAIADLGGSPEPEVVALEADENGVEPGVAFFVDSLFTSGTELRPTTIVSFGFTGISPERLHPIDFDGDGTRELWTFDPGGSGVCLRRAAAGGALEPC